MKDHILKAVKQFLDAHYHPSAPLLLGFSGGPDSLALLFLLLQCRDFFPLELHVAHVDHRWREESTSQAMELYQQIKKLGLPFHLHTLKEKTDEAGAREERLLFFSQLYTGVKAQALLLAHHANDQVETVLKRLLEGAGLYALKGMQGCSSLNGMQVWRPLLKVEKKDLLRWLKKKGLQGIEDPTNRDPQFLRSRMRQEIFPELEKSFGKGIVSNLLRFSEMTQELSEYLYKKNPLFSLPVARTDSTVTIDFNPYYPLDPLETKLFLKQFLQREGISLSHKTIKTLQELIQKKASNKKIDSILINKGILSLIKK
jgi:tRNA(Ile)-lysidine synthase